MSWPGIKPSTYVYVLTRNWAHNYLEYGMMLQAQLFTLLKYPHINKGNSFIFFTIMELTICRHNCRSKTNHHLPDKNNSINAFGIFFLMWRMYHNIVCYNHWPCSESNGTNLPWHCRQMRCRYCKFKVLGGLEEPGSLYSGSFCLVAAGYQNRPYKISVHASCFSVPSNIVTSLKGKVSHTVCVPNSLPKQLLLAKRNK